MAIGSKRWFGLGGLVALALLAGACGKQAQPPAAAAGPAGDTQYCDFKGGPENAAVKVVAYYPGGHEETLALVKSLMETFPGQVSVEIVDWRRPEGLKRRDDDGFSCGTVAINGKNTFDLVEDGKPVKVLFVRRVDAEWTAEDLLAAVKQELAAAQQN